MYEWRPFIIHAQVCCELLACNNEKHEYHLMWYKKQNDNTLHAWSTIGIAMCMAKGQSYYRLPEPEGEKPVTNSLKLWEIRKIKFNICKIVWHFLCLLPKEWIDWHRKKSTHMMLPLYYKYLSRSKLVMPFEGTNLMQCLLLNVFSIQNSLGCKKYPKRPGVTDIK